MKIPSILSTCCQCARSMHTLHASRLRVLLARTTHSHAQRSSQTRRAHDALITRFCCLQRSSYSHHTNRILTISASACPCFRVLVLPTASCLTCSVPPVRLAIFPLKTMNKRLHSKMCFSSEKNLHRKGSGSGTANSWVKMHMTSRFLYFRPPLRIASLI